MTINENNNEIEKNVINSDNALATDELDIENNETKIIVKFVTNVGKVIDWGNVMNYSSIEMFIVHLGLDRAKHL